MKKTKTEEKYITILAFIFTGILIGVGLLIYAMLPNRAEAAIYAQPGCDRYCSYEVTPYVEMPDTAILQVDAQESEIDRLIELVKQLQVLLDALRAQQSR